MSLNNVIRDYISTRLMILSDKCDGCPQVDVCEDQSNGGEARYCWPLIEAAILDELDFETCHKDGES